MPGVILPLRPSHTGAFSRKFLFCVFFFPFCFVFHVNFALICKNCVLFFFKVQENFHSVWLGLWTQRRYDAKGWLLRCSLPIAKCSQKWVGSANWWALSKTILWRTHHTKSIFFSFFCGRGGSVPDDDSDKEVTQGDSFKLTRFQLSGPKTWASVVKRAFARDQFDHSHEAAATWLIKATLLVASIAA